MIAARWTSAFAVALAAAAVAIPGTALASCITPLPDPTQRDPNAFKEFELLPLPPKAEGVVKIQVPSTGTRGINIDFYWVTFTKPKNTTGKDFFKTVRLKFGDFATGTKASFAFGPYETSEKADDEIRTKNEAKWKEADPTGALMSFKLASLFPWATLKAGKPTIDEKSGDVQVVCASDLDFVFATVESTVGGMHPVAGFRGFGLIADPNAETWTFYSKAIDRASGTWMNAPAYASVKGYNNLFCKGHLFWMEFFGEFRGFVEKDGMKVQDWSLKNHGPVDFPLGSGTGPWRELDCGTQTTPVKRP